MYVKDLLKLIDCDYDIIIDELPSAHRFAETVLNRKIDYSWESINKINKTSPEFLSSYSNCLSVNNYIIDKSLYMNLEVTRLSSGYEIIDIFVKYESL